MPSSVRGFRSVVARFSRTRFFRRVGPSVMPPLERAMSWLTRGRMPLSGLLVPSLVLHTVGARSGLARDSTIMYCPETTRKMLVTGSNFARAEHPSWSANLLAHPNAEVSMHGRRFPVRATLIGDDEREDVWQTIEGQWPGYRGYERTSGRRLRIFRLERTDADV
jgi:deazaflavin-dependent oxidoreductase (nitroreductase family)